MRLLLSFVVVLLSSLTCLVKAHNIHIEPRARGMTFLPAELPLFRVPKLIFRMFFRRPAQGGQNDSHVRCRAW
jgi:hypothetical protein